jgi:protein phosphatase
VCSDGLAGEVDDGSIARVLRAIRDPQEAANELVKAAIDAGGHDDVTALVIDAVAVGPLVPADIVGAASVALAG